MLLLTVPFISSQIEGAFIQGLGWVALEELKWGDPDHKWIRPGNLYTCGPGTYKIPSANDIPMNFKVSLLKVICRTTSYTSHPPFGDICLMRHNFLYISHWFVESMSS